MFAGVALPKKRWRNARMFDLELILVSLQVYKYFAAARAGRVTFESNDGSNLTG